MATELVEIHELENAIYQIFLLDSKYTVYMRQVVPKEKTEENFSAVASFDSLEEARDYVNAEGKKIL